MQTKQMVWQMQKNKELPPQTRRFIERADLWDPCCAKAIGQLYRKYVTQDYMRKDEESDGPVQFEGEPDQTKRMDER